MFLCRWLTRLVCGSLLLAAATIPLPAASPAAPAQLKIIEVKQADGEILSYRHLAGSTDVLMRGTRLTPQARIRLKVGSRPGFVELDINRGAITGLEPAARFGKDFLTYVLWAVSVDGRASNLGEITFDRERPVSINVTTSYQTFWLMVTAEPDFAVIDPSPRVVLYSAHEGARQDSRALVIKDELFFYTHYTDYDSAPARPNPAPNDLQQARKAVELASKAGILAVTRPSGAPGIKDEEQAREALELARTFLKQAEDAYRANPKDSNVVQFARTAAQIAENARALAVGAVGGVFLRQLETELEKLRAELSKTRTELARAQAASPSKEPGPVTSPEPPPPVEPAPADPSPGIAKNPITWAALLGWALALLLLLRRRPV